ncbi:MAG: aldo/keto reductase [Actinobacteria bacterium]|nr:aldo/keto reductase [Actinomycetota bacterium]
MSELLDVSSARTIGELGDVGPLSIGCWRLTGSDAENTAVISAAVDAGMTLIDNADVYGLDWGGTHFGACEEALGKIFSAIPGLLYQIHRPDNFTHPEEIAQAFNSLKSRGLVREFGVSNYTVAQTLALNAFVDNGLATTQPQLSATHLDPLRDGTLDLCMESGITPLAWSALAGGALATGKGIATALLAVLDELAARENVTRSAIAIAFVLAHPSHPVAIIGTQTPSRISELALATSVSLTRTDVYAIIQASDGIPLP